jgi:hypothetical protein
MEIVSGFMMMISSAFSGSGVVDHAVCGIRDQGEAGPTLEVLEAIEKRLAALESRVQPVEPERTNRSGRYSDTSAASSDESTSEHPIEIQ